MINGTGNPLKRRGTRRTERPEGTPKLFTIHSYLLTEKSSRCAAQIPFPPNPLTPPSTIVEGARNTFPRWGRGTTKWWMRRTPYGGSEGVPVSPRPTRQKPQTQFGGMAGVRGWCRGSPPRTCERWGFTESGAGNPLKRRGTRRTERPEGTPKLFTLHSYLLTDCPVGTPKLFTLHSYLLTEKSSRCRKLFYLYLSSLKYDMPRLAGGRFSRFLRRLTVIRTRIVTTYGSICMIGCSFMLTLM